MPQKTPTACILSPAGLRLTDKERALLADAQPWGMILMGRSCETPAQVRYLVDQIWDAMARPCMIFIDQEGGRVARLRAPHFREFSAAAKFEALGFGHEGRAQRATYLSYRLMGHMLADLGIHGNFAPTLDLRFADTHQVIGDRAFSNVPSIVSMLGKAALEGLADAGVVGCIKHMPGHGRAIVDSHKTLPRVDATAEALQQDMTPFQALAQGALMGMTAHIAYDAFNPNIPMTQSAEAIAAVIRGKIGFDGLLITDDLGMDALGGDLASRGRASLAAGCDMLLHCSGFLSDPEEIFREMQAVARVALPLSGRALRRTRAVEAAANTPSGFETSAMDAELEELLQFGV